MTTIPDIMRSVSEVLTTADELLEEGDAEDVGPLLASFLRTLLVDLDKLLVDQGPTGSRVLGKPNRPSLESRHRDCSYAYCILSLEGECPHYHKHNRHKAKAAPKKQSPFTVKVTKTKNPVRNKFEGHCIRCGVTVLKGEGYVLPAANSPNPPTRKWFTFCATDYEREVA